MHEQLELPQHNDRDVEEDQDLDETEKALLREMCNVSNVEAFAFFFVIHPQISISLN